VVPLLPQQKETDLYTISLKSHFKNPRKLPKISMKMEGKKEKKRKEKAAQA